MFDFERRAHDIPMPEPASVAIMAAGLGLIGFVARRRRSMDMRDA